MNTLLLILSLVTYNVPSGQKSAKLKTAQITFTANELQQTDSIPELWHLLVFENGGCLGGGQYVSSTESTFELNRSTFNAFVFSNNDWVGLAKRDKSELTHFLISILSDTTETKVHTCPLAGATNGEMAIYALQHIHNKNWFDFPEFAEYKDKPVDGSTENRQVWLQNILNNEIQRKKLVELYLMELKD